ncbi:hypothetical protein QUF74_04515 [Candidatus Halobeggiatoa sp. HSG11]|nr:hypothetical protein [Candidatus Halobeggiatoa sp. HSG11]
MGTRKNDLPALTELVIEGPTDVKLESDKDKPVEETTENEELVVEDG